MTNTVQTTAWIRLLSSLYKLGLPAIKFLLLSLSFFLIKYRNPDQPMQSGQNLFISGFILQYLVIL